MIEGQLVVINKKTLQVKFCNANGKEVSFNIKESELSAPLMEKKAKKLAELNEIEVELEEVAGQPKKITEKGQQWESPRINISTETNRKARTDKRNQDSSESFKSNKDRIGKILTNPTISTEPTKNKKVLPPLSRNVKVLPPPKIAVKEIEVEIEVEVAETILERTDEQEVLES